MTNIPHTDPSAQHTEPTLRVLWVRHTAVDPACVSVCYGQTDVPLHTTFEQEAAITAEKLQAYTYDAVFSSPLSRAYKLATYCGHSDAQLDPRLMELDFGDWELVPWTDILQGVDARTFFAPYLTRQTPDGESVMDQYRRVCAFLQEQMPSEGHRCLLVFCHGGVINGASAMAGRSDLRDAFAHIPPYGSITDITYTPQMLQEAAAFEPLAH